MRFECSANKAGNSQLTRIPLARDLRGDGTDESAKGGPRIPIFHEPAAMPVTVGKIEELARHFHGERVALLRLPYRIAREPPSQSLIRKGDGGSLRENRRTVVVVFCGNFVGRPAQPALLTLVVASCCSKDASRFYFRWLCEYRCSQSGATKSEHFGVPRRNHVFSCSRDTSDRICRLPTSYRDRARQILFLAPVRVLVGRSRSVQAQSPTQAHKI
jgi:hypothetical protein